MTEQNAEQTTGYVDLATQNYSATVEALAAANQRWLAYGKSIFDIVSRPYASTSIENTFRENFERANELVDVTVSELQAGGTHAAKLAGSFAEQSARLQETTMHTLRGLMHAGISNLHYVKDATGQQMDGFAKRVEEMQARAERAVASPN